MGLLAKIKYRMAVRAALRRHWRCYNQLCDVVPINDSVRKHVYAARDELYREIEILRKK